MNGTSNVTHGELATDRTERSLRTLAGGGSMVEAIGGIAAVVLAIIGLCGSMQNYMLSIATIVLGASLVLEGGAIAASYRRAMFSVERNEGSAELGGAARIESLAGLTGIVLGILALLGVGGGGALSHLVSTSVIVFGAALLLSGSAVSRLSSFWSQYSDESKAGGHMLIGLAAVVLGILALLGINAMTLNFVALLALGVAVLLSGSSFGAHTMTQKRVAA